MNVPALFTENQMAFFNRCPNSWFNVAEGGKRGGKNVLLTLAFCRCLQLHPSRLHLVAGVSTAAARLNILDCDGYGMTNFFEGHCREGHYQNRDCLYIDTKTGQKIVLVSGGGKDRDERLIKGNTYGMAYITEANECHPNFIQEVFDRTLASPDRKLFHDLNPKSPKHWYYTDVLDFHAARQEKDPGYGYNYGHFTIADNLSVSKEQMRRVLSTYDKNSVWYRRDILGKRAAAEGLVYRTFSDNPEPFLIDDTPEYLKATKQRPAAVMIGVDFGGTRSATAFKAALITQGYREVIVDMERHISGEIDPAALNREFCDFVRGVSACWGVSQTRADNAESILIRGLRMSAQAQGLKTDVRNAMKKPVIDRVRLVNLLMAQGRFKVARNCRHMIEALSDAQYDPKHEDERLDDGSTDIDSLDAMEYCLEPHFYGLEAVGMRRGK